MNPLLRMTFKQTKRIVIIIIGFTILLIGVLMIVLPGPAILVIPLGLGVLATELLWARKLFDKIKSKMKKKERIKQMPIRPSDKEEEYFTRLELERKKKTEEEKVKQMAEEDKRKLKELHYMYCPKCGMKLSEIDYKGILIDKCFQCDGIWLDAGELQAISSLEKTSLDKLFSVFKK